MNMLGVRYTWEASSRSKLCLRVQRLSSLASCATTVQPPSLARCLHDRHFITVIKTCLTSHPARYMDLIGLTASIAQLAAYGKSVARQLSRLYNAIRTGPDAYRDQASNISVLLNIVSRVGEQRTLQEESILLLLREISVLVGKIQNLLDQKGIFGLNWALIARSEALSEAFVALNTKRDLLHLYISERNHNVLSQIQNNIIEMNRNHQGQKVSQVQDQANARFPLATTASPFETALVTWDRTGQAENSGSYANTSTQRTTTGGANVGANVDMKQMNVTHHARQQWANGYQGAPTIKAEDMTIGDNAESRIGNAKDTSKESKSTEQYVREKVTVRTEGARRTG
ncbi:hypothetical protein EV356DRAFT_513510 [Viridothelium virens]|uniref:Uncharacterized protein n=1 Tax=Viridothelium virens TaxID=1048519 RepID=A0A6A6HD20_VIRVR|nr:hypothetical protein EV356DRAFT_513510 [Viridothelium virens]